MKSEREASLLTLPELIRRAEAALLRSAKAFVNGSNGQSLSWRTATFGFLMVEAETGLIFARIALDSGGNNEKVIRNAANARRAYDTVLRFRGRAKLDPQESAELTGRMKRLEAQLRDLGEET